MTSERSHVKKRAKQKAGKMQDRRISIQLVTPEEQELYRQLTIMAAIEEIYVREIVIKSLQGTVKEYFAKSPPPEKK